MNYIGNKGKSDFSASGVSFVSTREGEPQRGSEPKVAIQGPAAATVLLALLDDLLEPTKRRDHDAPKAKPPLPPAAGRLLTGFGPRKGYGSEAYNFHTGLDFYAPRGTPVFAVRPGVVSHVVHDHADREGFIGYGNAVVIHHEDEDLWSFYAHLDETLVLPGMEIEGGQVIGRVGNTTNGRLPGMIVRLHFELRKRAALDLPPFPGPYRINSIDPEQWLAEHGVVCDDRGRFVVGPLDQTSEKGDGAGKDEPDEESLRESFERLTPTPSLDDLDDDWES